MNWFNTTIYHNHTVHRYIDLKYILFICLKPPNWNHHSHYNRHQNQNTQFWLWYVFIGEIGLSWNKKDIYVFVCEMMMFWSMYAVIIVDTLYKKNIIFTDERFNLRALG